MTIIFHVKVHYKLFSEIYQLKRKSPIEDFCICIHEINDIFIQKVTPSVDY